MSRVLKSHLHFGFICDVVFFISLAILGGFVLWLPCFPSGDGPLHAYYAQVFGALIGGGTSYSQFYAIRHIVQPYCIHYYALLFFRHWLGSEKAEEAFVSIILVVTALGFRFMAQQLGKNASVISLFMIPLLLDWTLGAGFLNYCLGVGIFFWAIGCWHLLRDRRLSPPMLGYLTLLTLLVFTHPVPLLVLIFFCTCDMALIIWQKKKHAIQGNGQSLRVKLVAFGFTCLALLVPLAIADKSKVTSVWRDCFPHRSVLLHLLEAKSLTYFWSTSPQVIIFDALVLCMFPAAILLSQRDLRSRWASRALSAADRQILIMVLFTLSTITMPRSVGGGANFSERMWDVCWPMVIALAAAAQGIAGRRRSTLMVGVAMIIFTAVVAVPRLDALAAVQDELSRVALPVGRVGLLLEPLSTTEKSMGAS
jgi:hypothetical protein